MHADVIVVGQRSEAFLAAYLFARRGFRTLLLGPETVPPVGGRMLVEPDLAERLKPVEPPPESIIARHLTVEFWSPDERSHATVRQLPFMLLDESVFCRTLEASANRTRNFKLLRGIEPESLLVSQGVVTGVRVPSGDEIKARLVVEADSFGAGPREEFKALWPFPDLRPHEGRFFSQRRRVGAAASAWTMGTLSVRVKPGQHALWNYRVQPDEMEIAALTLPGSKLKPDRLVGRVYREAGLEETAVVGELSSAPHFAPSAPAPLAAGYLGIGQVAGHANPWLPIDRTPALSGALQAWLAGADALDEGTATVKAMWDYVRSHASDQGARQAYAFALASGLMRLDGARLDSLFRHRLVDTYFLSCLARNRPLKEDLLDGLSRSLRAVANPAAMVTWHRLLSRSRKLAGLYRSVPLQFDRSEAMAWQEKVLNAW